MSHDNRADASLGRLGRHQAVGSQQRDVRLRSDEGGLLVVLIIFGRAGVALARMTEFADHAAQTRIGAHLGGSAQVHANLRTVVAAQHRTVVDERHAAPLTGSRHGGAHARDTAARDHQVVRLGRLRSSGKGSRTAAEGVERRDVRRGHVVGIGGEPHGIATAVEAGEIDQCHLDRSAPQCRFSGVLPHPPVAPGAEHLLQAASADLQGEASGALAVEPGCHPVIGPHVGVVGPRLGKTDRRDGIGHGRTQTVRDQVGRPHAVHELLVDRPAAPVAETLRFDQNSGREGLHAGTDRHEDGQQRLFHISLL